MKIVSKNNLIILREVCVKDVENHKEIIQDMDNLTMVFI